MTHYCNICDEIIKLKSKNKHFKTIIHKELDKCKQIQLPIETLNINDIDEIFSCLHYRI